MYFTVNRDHYEHIHNKENCNEVAVIFVCENGDQ